MRDRVALDLCCLVGVVVSGALLVGQARHTDAVEIRDLRTERTGVVSSVRFRASNTTDTSQCPEIRVVARDQEGRDLAEVVVLAGDDGSAIEPGRSRGLTSRIELSAQDVEEKLADIRAYVYELHDC